MSNWFEQLTQITEVIASYVWGIPTVIFLVGTGLYLTIRLKFVQFRGLGSGLKIVTGRTSEPGEAGETSPFQALCTSLSATIGTGNIAGVATAVVLGGPGAIFWMWITAIVGMATRFASSTLAVKFRQINPDGEVSGGPMYTLKYGLNMPKLAFVYALLTLIASFGIGNTVQSNSIVGGMSYLMPELLQYEVYVGIVLAFLVGMVIIGGIKRVSHFAEFIVPFMAVMYFVSAMTIVVVFSDKVLDSFMLIFNRALNPYAAGGGAVGAAIQYGVSRGIFSNEAGLGAATIAHATAKVSHPAKQGFVAMLGPLIDTLFICTLTGLVIVITASWDISEFKGLDGAGLTAHAFSLGTEKLGFGAIGGWVVGISLLFFAFTTMIAWSYYGDRCAKFIFGPKAVLPYRILFCIFIVIGAAFPLELVWNLADIANIFMAVPNLISLILLAGVVDRLRKEYSVRT